MLIRYIDVESPGAKSAMSIVTNMIQEEVDMAEPSMLSGSRRRRNTVEEGDRLLGDWRCIGEGRPTVPSLGFPRRRV